MISLINTLSDNDNLTIYYLILRRELKFSTKRLFELFSKIKNVDDLSKFSDNEIERLLFSGKNSLLTNKIIISKIKDLSIFQEHFQKYRSVIEICRKKNISIISGYEKRIPPLIQQIELKMRDVIFLRGNVLDSDLKSFSICGTRKPTQDGATAAYKIAAYLSKLGLTLINGFAKGIDIDAYKGVKSVNGRYIGVLASGVLNIYPPDNLKYVNLIIKNGAFVTQGLPESRVTKKTLQIRNRLTAALSLGSIFIEGTYKSGTKWQFKFAKEFKKPIFLNFPLRSKFNGFCPKM